MSPGQLLFALLTQSAPVVALVGTRVYPLIIEQGRPRPAIAYQLISRVPAGSPNCVLGDDARVQLSLYADTYSGLEALSQATRKALHGTSLAGAYLELTNEIDQPYQTGALCYLRTQDYELELP